MGGPCSRGGRGGGRSEADAGDEAGGREAGWPRPLPSACTPADTPTTPVPGKR